ncbi:hypothetical protein WS66_23745 [Burkholderia sp. LA-2-3-30-S1-D2]|nr:hypothetical protein WS66_23745 [Burkholderia sp. LA-2-3-30-S1-D2]KVE20445.1 hypothetical protein WS66_01295 [Burkholderia sp. LA-2-3-30-S1-D2]
MREQLLQIAEPGFHQHAPVGTTRRDARRGVAGAAATRADESDAGRLPDCEFGAVAVRRRRARTTSRDVRTP